MKKYCKWIIVLCLSILMPTLSVLATSTIPSTPNAKIEYGYTAGVSCGTIRYISQIRSSENFHSQYWGSWVGQAGIECGTASISMALSYIGVNKTPKDILDAHSGVTYFGDNWGGAKYSSPGVSNGMQNYINGGGKYSPVIVHFPAGTYSPAGHYVILAGKVSNTCYAVVDPARNSVWNLNTSDAFYKAIDQTFQYYNANAKPVVNSLSISGAKLPGTLTQGNVFCIYGTISSPSKLKTVTVGVYDVKGSMKTGKTVSPNSTSYDIHNIDNDILFNKVPAGIYRYKVTASNQSETKDLVNHPFVILSKDRSISDGKYRILTACNNSYCIGIEGNSGADRANVCIQSKELNNRYQQFSVSYQGNGYYKILNVGSDKALDVQGGEGSSGTNIHQFMPNGSNAQLWQILPAGDGTYYFVPKCGTATTMDLAIGDVSNVKAGANIYIYNPHLGLNQRWKFETAAHVHEWDSEYTVDKAATCTEAGSRSIHCRSCNEKKDVQSISPLGHAWGNWVETRQATCTQDGVKTSACTRCHAEQTVTIPKIGHTPGAERKENEKEASCTEDGSYDRVIRCSKCGTEISRKTVVIKATGHQWDDGKVVKWPTSDEEGEKVYTCTVCGEEKTEIIPPTEDEDEDEDEDEGNEDDEVDEDELPHSFVKMQLRAKKITKTSITLSWKKVKLANSYTVYGCRAGGEPEELICYDYGTIVKWTHKKLKKGCYYEYYVEAHDEDGTLLESSNVVYIATNGGKVGNPGSIKLTNVKNGKITLKKDRSFTIKAKTVQANKKLKVKKYEDILFESSNEAVAEVDMRTGEVTAMKKGQCYVWAYSQNGLSKKIKVTVK